MDADRRTVLAALAGALAGCTSDRRGDSETTETARTTGAPPDGTDLPPVEEWSTDRPEWERAADERIDEHRRSDLAITVLDGGEPVPDASVDVTLQRHAFDFSTAYNVNRHFELRDDHPYRQYVGELFDEVVFENAHKWRQWTQPGAHERADRVVQFLRDRGLTIAGAPVVWQKPGEEVLPDEVWAAVQREDEERLRALVREHVETIVEHYVTDHDVTQWVLLNEQLGHHVITDVLSDAPPWEAPPLREWYAHAAEVAPEARLAVNEYDVLALDRPTHRDRYAVLVEFLLDGDGPLHEVGFQGHTLGASERIGPTEQWQRLQRFADLGDVDLVVSEFDTPGFDSDRTAGQYLYRFLKVLYSHPDAAGFRLWGYWDGQHWRDDAPLFHDDWTPKPGYHAYATLRFREWMTDESGTTGETGTYRTRADLGTYRVTVAANGAERAVERTVTSPTGETAWTVRL